MPANATYNETRNEAYNEVYNATYYLIDFENVNEDNLLCPDKLNAQDQVHIFSTRNVPKISIEVLAAFNSCKLFSHIVCAGKQSLDMHLVSYLGYLLGKNGGAPCKYVIVSSDADYDKIIAFWQKQTQLDIARRAGLAGKAAKNAAPKPLLAKTRKKSASAVSTKTAPDKGRLNCQPKQPLANEVQRVLSQANYNSEIVNAVAALCAKHSKKGNAKQSVYQAIVGKYGQKQGLSIYNQIKRYI